MKKPLILLLFILNCASSNANEGIGMTQDYGNVHVLSYKEVDVEAFRKAFIIGQLAKKIADELKYTDPIYLDFRNNLYRDSLPPIYHLCFENLKYPGEQDDVSEKLVVRQYANDYDIAHTLKLLEFAILNKVSIKSLQKEKENTIKYGKRKFLSVSDEKIRGILNSPLTEEVARVIQIRVERPILSGERKTDISYYWQNNQYHIIRNGYVRSEKENFVLLTLPNIYQFDDLDLAFLIFDSPASFYYIHVNNYDEKGNNWVSSRHVIDDIGDTDWGKSLTRISDGDVTIYFTHGPMGSGQRRMLLYFHKTDALVQDVYTATGTTSSDRVFQPMDKPKTKINNQ